MTSFKGKYFSYVRCTIAWEQALKSPKEGLLRFCIGLKKLTKYIYRKNPVKDAKKRGFCPL